MTTSSRAHEPATTPSTTIPSIDEIKKAIDPDAWAARLEDQRTIGAQDAFERRRAESTAAAKRVHALLEHLA